jgi:hypothetical protein
LSTSVNELKLEVVYNGWCSIENFTIFSAAKFDEFIQQNTGKELEGSSANDIHGFCTGMQEGNLITYG